VSDDIYIVARSRGLFVSTRMERVTIRGEEREPIMHEHVCSDCERVFGCEGQCDSGNESLCEECDIAAKRANVGNGPVTAFDSLILKDGERWAC
jgi:hypothetical protein